MPKSGEAESVCALLHKTDHGIDLEGSAVLIRPNAILTTLHCFEFDFKDYEIFVPGVGEFKLDKGWTSKSENTYGLISKVVQGANDDLAIVKLDGKVHSILPAKLLSGNNSLSKNWKPEREHRMLVSGFGIGERLTGLRQCFDLPGSSCSVLEGGYLGLGHPKKRVDHKDSGGPIFWIEEDVIVGLNKSKREEVGSKDRAILLTEKSLEWIDSCLEQEGFETQTQAGSLIEIKLNDEREISSNEAPIPLRERNSDLRLAAGQEMTITANTIRYGEEIAINLGFAEEEQVSCDSAKIYPIDRKKGETTKTLYCYLRACKVTTQAQIFCSITEPVP